MSIQMAELTFQQDLNGDSQTGPMTATIETAGVTDLVQVANQYFLQDGGTGPSLKHGGVVVTAGQFGEWTPIGVEQTAGGYQVAWRFGSADQFLVWNVDSNGNFTSNATSIVPGAAMSIQMAEPTFQQDLNGDSQTGPATTTIETARFHRPGAGGQSVLPARQQRGRPFAEARRGGGYRRPVRRVDADRRRADGGRLPGGVEVRQRRSVPGVERRQQR